MAKQFTVNPDLQASGRQRVESDATDVTQQEEEQETKGFLYSYVFRRAHTDVTLTGEEVQMFDSASETVVPSQGTTAEVVGRKLAEIGDEIDAQYESEMKEIVRLTGSPESAFKMFVDVATNLFEWDQQGGARINVGRIAALLAYCYHLCKTYLGQHVGAGTLGSFLLLVGGWLFKFLLKAKFYEWLEKQGGWGQMLSLLTKGWGNNVFLVIGVASLAIWAYSYFKK